MDKQVQSEVLAQYEELHPGEDRRGFTLLDLVYAEGSPLDALVYSSLLWPEFVEYSGIVVLARVAEDAEDLARIDEALSRLPPTQVEQSFNYVDVSELFGRRSLETSEELDHLLVTRLQQMWRAKLKHDFPTRQFEVECVAPSDAGGAYGLHFWTAR